MSEYIYLIHPYRHEIFEQPTPEEQAAMEAHFEYLKRATAEGVVLLAGPCLDETFSLVVFRAEDELRARAEGAAGRGPPGGRGPSGPREAAGGGEDRSASVACC